MTTEEIVCFHEAGHACVALASGLTVASALVSATARADGRRGVVFYRGHEHRPLDRAISALAGRAAEIRVCGRAHFDGRDLERIRQVLILHLAVDPADVDGRIRALQKFADGHVAIHWGWITRTAQALRRRRMLTGADIELLQREEVRR